MKSLNKTVIPIFYCSVFFVSKSNLFDVFLRHCSWYQSRVAAVERLPVLYHSADYISFPLGSLGLLWNIRKWSSLSKFIHNTMNRGCRNIIPTCSKPHLPEDEKNNFCVLLLWSEVHSSGWAENGISIMRYISLIPWKTKLWVLIRSTSPHMYFFFFFFFFFFEKYKNCPFTASKYWLDKWSLTIYLSVDTNLDNSTTVSWTICLG